MSVLTVLLLALWSYESHCPLCSYQTDNHGTAPMVLLQGRCCSRHCFLVQSSCRDRAVTIATSQSKCTVICFSHLTFLCVPLDIEPRVSHTYTLCAHHCVLHPSLFILPTLMHGFIKLCRLALNLPPSCPHFLRSWDYRPIPPSQALTCSLKRVWCWGPDFFSFIYYRRSFRNVCILEIFEYLKLKPENCCLMSGLTELPSVENSVLDRLMENRLF